MSRKAHHSPSNRKPEILLLLQLHLSQEPVEKTNIRPFDNTLLHNTIAASSVLGISQGAQTIDGQTKVLWDKSVSQHLAKLQLTAGCGGQE